MSRTVLDNCIIMSCGIDTHLQNLAALYQTMSTMDLQCALVQARPTLSMYKHLVNVGVLL